MRSLRGQVDLERREEGRNERREEGRKANRNALKNASRKDKDGLD